VLNDAREQRRSHAKCTIKVCMEDCLEIRERVLFGFLREVIPKFPC
jgi:hypothetical protein